MKRRNLNGDKIHLNPIKAYLREVNMILQKKRNKLIISLISIAMVICLAISCFGIRDFGGNVDADTSSSATPQDH